MASLRAKGPGRREKAPRSKRERVRKAALRRYRKLAGDCIGIGSVVESELLTKFGRKFFRVNPITVSPWRTMAIEQTPSPLPPRIPLMIAQGLGDNVVLPNTTALYAQRSCRAGSNLTMAWLGGTGHIRAARVAGPLVSSWLFDRFAGRPAGNTCDQPLPVSVGKPDG